MFHTKQLLPGIHLEVPLLGVHQHALQPPHQYKITRRQMHHRGLNGAETTTTASALSYTQLYSRSTNTSKAYNSIDIYLANGLKRLRTDIFNFSSQLRTATTALSPWNLHRLTGPWITLLCLTKKIYWIR